MASAKPKIGRPLKFKTPQALQKAINAFFADCDPHIEYRDEPFPYVTVSGQKRPPRPGEIPEGYEIVRVPYRTEQKAYTVSGLALALGTNRETLNRYGKKDAFYDTITRAKERCHTFWEGVLNSRNAPGAQFNLKNNWGYQDKTEVEHTERPTGYEELSDEELMAKREELRRKNNPAGRG